MPKKHPIVLKDIQTKNNELLLKLEKALDKFEWAVRQDESCPTNQSSEIYKANKTRRINARTSVIMVVEEIISNML